LGNDDGLWQDAPLASNVRALAGLMARDFPADVRRLTEDWRGVDDASTPGLLEGLGNVRGNLTEGQNPHPEGLSRVRRSALSVAHSAGSWVDRREADKLRTGVRLLLPVD
jgi:hypothetical protein